MPQRAALWISNERPRYLEPVTPLVFPVEEQVPESQLHFDLKTLLYQLLSDHLGLEATVGSDQFVYYDAADPKQVVAPDVYVRLEPRGERIRSWKTWERGAPDVAVEIVSDSDSTDGGWAQKLQRYRSLGVRELVRFESDANGDTRLQIWDRVDGSLVERAVSGSRAPSSVLPVHWIVAGALGIPKTLRIADEKGSIVPTQDEARQAAEARLRELEAELARLKRGQ